MAIEKINFSSLKSYLTARPREFHKGDAGHVLIVGGDHGYSGAVRMAGEAALRVGAGLVSIATRRDHATLLNLTRPELMCHAAETAQELSRLMKKADVIIAGPGMGEGVWAHKLLKTIFASEKPLVIDADGLNFLAKHPMQKNNWLLTPHPGEAARLLWRTRDEIQQDRLAAIQQLHETYGGMCILKGASSLVLTSDGVSVCDAGNPGMATAGMGDVLSGVLGGLIAQGIPVNIAAKLGVLLHAMAGDEAAKQGQRGMIASDLFLHLRRLVN